MMVTLKQMCEILSISRRTIQCYEKAELMMPKGKNKFGHLLYDEESINRAKKIRFLQALGFKLKEVKEIIDSPNEIKKKGLEKRLKELEIEKKKLEELMEKAYKIVEAL